MKKIEEAIIYATVMHQGKVRKLGSIPYILHPLEVAQILSTMTDDQDIITAGILHDIVEDTDGTLKEIEKRFGERVALLVSSESENDYPGESRSESWRRRKEEALKVLQDTDDQGIRMLWLADKLSNISKLIDLVMIFHFYRYVRITLDFKGKLADWADKGIPILMALETIVILSNFFYPLTFMIDADGFYQATGASSLEDIYLAVASLISTVVIIRSESPRSQKIAALTFIFLPVVNYATMGGEFGNASQYGMVLMSLIIIFCIIFNDKSSKLASTQTELNMATDIQASMLPSIFPAFPAREEFDLYASMILPRKLAATSMISS